LAVIVSVEIEGLLDGQLSNMERDIVLEYDGVDVLDVVNEIDFGSIPSPVAKLETNWVVMVLNIGNNSANWIGWGLVALVLRKLSTISLYAAIVTCPERERH